MRVLSEERRTFDADRPIAKRRAFGAARNDADVLGRLGHGERRE
jgi:hypothetical protein